ncbi:hypothetical protein ACFSQ7_16310 [Paenibacillus rhizoplanae]
MPFKDNWAANIWPAAAFADWAAKNEPSLFEDINAGRKKSGPMFPSSPPSWTSSMRSTRKATPTLTSSATATIWPWANS